MCNLQGWILSNVHMSLHLHLTLQFWSSGASWGAAAWLTTGTMLGPPLTASCSS